MRYNQLELRQIRRKFGFTPGIAFSGCGGAEPLSWMTEDGKRQQTLTAY